jgi:hypothetical protein
LTQMVVGDSVQSPLAIHSVRRDVRRLPMGLWRAHKTLTRGEDRNAALETAVPTRPSTS